MAHRRFASLLFLCALLFYAIFVPMGHLPSDTEYALATAKSLIATGSLAVEPVSRLPDLKPGVGGRYYSKFGVGYALSLVPQVAAAQALGPFLPIDDSHFEQLVVSFTNTVLAAIIIVLFFMIFMALGYTRRISLVAVALIGTASLLLPYSKIIHAEIPTTLVLLLFFLAIVRHNRLTLRMGIALGVLASVLVFLKSGNLPFAAFIGGYGIWLFFRRGGGGRANGTASGLAAGLAGLIGSAFLFSLLLLWLNHLRFGDPFNSGYGSEQIYFITPLFTGLHGLLFSPSKSLLLFCPLVIPAILMVPRMIKRVPAPTVTVLVMAVVTMLFYAKWHDWHGGWCWGPRLILPALLLLHLFLPEALLAMRERRLLRVIVPLAAAVGLVMNLLGALVWYQQVYHFQDDSFSIRNSQPEVAARLFVNKLLHRPEVYRLPDYGITYAPESFARNFHVTVRGDSVDFHDFEKFQGFATIWSGVGRLYHVPWLAVIPALLLLSSLILFLRLWRSGCYSGN